ncbi:MAG TPA: alpha/beta hydrolase [Burkholderiales bacterium]|nr:alpha/beta hydrolase [Burkholderiales bacterium]
MTSSTRLCFAHANGFPASCYAALLHPLSFAHEISWIDAIGTDPRYPPTEGWTHLVEQWIDFVENEFSGTPVYGIGHSLGGYLNYLAAVRRPELFRGIVLLDAPLIGPFRGSLLGATKRLGIVDRVTPAGATRDRRSTWHTREEARAHFLTRRLFKNFTSEALDDYVQHGLVDDGHGRLKLKIDPRIEYEIYRTIPHDMMRHLPKLRVPAAFIGGAESDVVRRIRLAGMRPKFSFRKVPGGHLFPFEHPREAARSIAQALADLSASPRAA